MYLMIYIASFLVLLALLILLVPVKACVFLKKDTETALFQYKITIAGAIVFSNIKKNNKQTTKIKKNDKHSSAKINASDVMSVYREFADQITALINYAADNALHFIKTDIYINFGTSDAAMTGITYGVISGVIYSLIGLIDSKCSIDNKSINITPDFNASVFKTECECIVKLRNVHIIVIAVKLILLMLSIRKKNPDKKQEYNLPTQK